MWREFREFLLKQNALALAVGVIVGAAMGRVVTSLVSDLLMPMLSLGMPGGDWPASKIVLSPTVCPDGKPAINAINYGALARPLMHAVSPVCCMRLVPSFRSCRAVNEPLRCAQFYARRFSTFHGVPVALFGGLWFVVAGLLSIAGLTARPPVRDSVPGYLVVLSTLALAVVLYMGYASFVVLKVICPLCLTTYAAVIGLFLV